MSITLTNTFTTPADPDLDFSTSFSLLPWRGGAALGGLWTAAAAGLGTGLLTAKMLGAKPNKLGLRLVPAAATGAAAGLASLYLIRDATKKLSDRL